MLKADFGKEMADKLTMMASHDNIGVLVCAETSAFDTSPNLSRAFH
jgi:hypothetical protein